MHKMIFGCLAPSRVDAARALLLAESIHTFAGHYSNLSFLLMRPVGGEQLTKTQYKNIELLDVELHLFELEPTAAAFPFAGKAVASTAAEALSIAYAHPVSLTPAAVHHESAGFLPLRRSLRQAGLEAAAQSRSSLDGLARGTGKFALAQLTQCESLNNPVPTQI